MHDFFAKRFAELPAGSFQSSYLEHFAIPLAFPIAWIVTVVELFVGLSLFFGIAVRVHAALALFLVLNFAAGGFYMLYQDFLHSFNIAPLSIKNFSTAFALSSTSFLVDFVFISFVIRIPFW